MKTQVYQANTYDEAVSLSQIGVDLIGLVVNINSDFPGVLSIDEAIKVLAGITQGSRSVILPFTEDLNAIETIIQKVSADIIHIAVEPQIIQPEDLKLLKSHFPEKKFMRTIPVVDDSSLQLAKQYDRIADYLLLDTKLEGQLGVTGSVHDWKISKQIVEQVSIPVILAGGLGIENVLEAISFVKPYGVDSKTKTDIPGTNQKDLAKVKQFVELAKSSHI